MTDSPPASLDTPVKEGVASQRHAMTDDVIAIASATLMISLALTLYQSAGLLTGGVSGMAFLVHYASGVDFGSAFFLLNLPFYWLAVRRLGWAFAGKTFAAVAVLSLLTNLAPSMLAVQSVHPAYAGVVGGVLLGTGFLVLFRHKASLGGIGILAAYLQERHGWRAGYVQMATDCVIVATALLFVEPSRIAWSILSAVVVNLILALNHKPGRYNGF